MSAVLQPRLTAKKKDINGKTNWAKFPPLPCMPMAKLTFSLNLLKMKTFETGVVKAGEYS